MIEQPFVIVDGCNQAKRKMELKKNKYYKSKFTLKKLELAILELIANVATHEV